jgi:hypothetical protein
MSRITRAIAEEMAQKLLEKKYEANKKRYNEIAEMLEVIVESKIPKDIMKVFNDPISKNYIDSRSSVYINGQGLNHDYILLNKALPCNRSSSILLSDEKALYISKKLEIWKKNKKKNSELLQKTTETLVSLRTYKKVQDLFPEAAVFLPPVQTTCTDLQCISSIVKEINSDEER